MKEALDGLRGVRSVGVDLAHDRFDVEYDADRVAPRDLLAAIVRLGYAPELVVNATGQRAATGTVASVDPAALPAAVRAVLERALAAHKPVLVRFTGPG